MYSILFSSEKEAKEFAERHDAVAYESAQGKGNWIVYKSTSSQKFLDIYRRRLTSHE